MAKPFSLQTLLDLSQLRMDEAGRKLVELLAGAQKDDQRVVLLQQYRDEYSERFVAAAKLGIGRDTMNNYQFFLVKLDQAIAQAQNMAAQAKQRTVAGQRAWLDQRSQVKAFDTLSQRHHSREQFIENRKEQKVQDEHAARNHRVDGDSNEE